MPRPLAILAVAALATGALPAQQPTLLVDDLLAPRARRALDDGTDWVHRSFSGLEFGGDDETLPWHAIHGESALLPRAFDQGSDEEPRGRLTADSLSASIEAMRGAHDDSLSFVELGEHIGLRTAYPEQVTTTLQRLREMLPGPIDLELTLERLTDAETALLLQGTLRFTNGETRTLADVEHRQVLRDFDVEIAQSAATANPIEHRLSYGTSIAARARPLPFRDEVVVELVARSARPIPTAPIRPHTEFGPLDRIATRVDEAGLAFRLGRGEPTTHEWRDLDGALLRLTCRATWRSPAAPRGAEPRIVWSPLLGPPVLGFRSARRPPPEELVERAEVAATVEWSISEDGSDCVRCFEIGDAGGGILVLGGDAAGARLGRTIDQRIDALLFPVDVEIDVFDVPLAAVGTDAATDARPLARLRGNVLAELPACFASAREQSYLDDFDVEVAQSARIPDPKTRPCEDGWFATVRVDRVEGGRLGTVNLCLQVERLVELRQMTTRINAAVQALANVTDDSRPPSVWMPQDVVTLEQPVVRTMRLVEDLELDAEGRAELVRSATGLLGPGRALVVRARIRPSD